MIDDWIDIYKEDKDKALLQLMQFFINAAGCRGKISPDMQSTMEHAEIIRRMTEEFDEVSLLLFFLIIFFCFLCLFDNEL